MRRRTIQCLAAAAAAGVLLALTAAPAGAAGSAYGDWSLSGPTGTLGFPVVGLPRATVTTDGTNPAVASGGSAFLNAATPFGAAYGGSQGHPYLTLRTAAGRGPSTTTLAFERPLAAGSWAFALGDIDADTVRITGTAADGSPLTPANLGFRGAFNYCAAAPLPSGCGGVQGDVPRWDGDSATLIGNGADTYGASGWFRPVKAVRDLTLVFSVQSGAPVGQLWVAAATASVTGRVTADGCAPPDHGTLLLRHPDGTPVTGADGEPVTAGAGEEGTYRFDGLAPDAYRVAVRVPGGYDAPVPVRAADATAGDAGGVDFALACHPVVLPEQPPVEVGSDLARTVDLPPALCGGTDLAVTRRPGHGTVRILDNCHVRYEPDEGWTGPDDFAVGGHTADGTLVTAAERVAVVQRPVLAATGTGGVATAAVAAGLALLLGAVAVRAVRRG
ncbi:carboxypeptidase regulatory-like domain-containing protein [Kitasatospora sp. NA04385]|uniref:carboxypeptidase-like regulatory domain-containing protein n=1 Tax=Kitasatospora sp. NA04385 TaxID=2742135 RepID=UPI0015907B58|nr:carboxypeptidase-like regulatory domain-containing protein [Kitasatospora sp. NA04385]QKW21309.1 carboxypeptidase regulatory-like domain-containing protein [Kitasatospora sp. NA04385]